MSTFFCTVHLFLFRSTKCNKASESLKPSFRVLRISGFHEILLLTVLISNVDFGQALQIWFLFFHSHKKCYLFKWLPHKLKTKTTQIKVKR